MFSCRFHRGHVQGDGERGDAQQEAIFVGVNPEIVTPDRSIGSTPGLFNGDWSMQLGRGGAWLAS